jgi:hypothetical protein
MQDSISASASHTYWHAFTAFSRAGVGILQEIGLQTGKRKVASVQVADAHDPGERAQPARHALRYGVGCRYQPSRTNPARRLCLKDYFAAPFRKLPCCPAHEVHHTFSL